MKTRTKIEVTSLATVIDVIKNFLLTTDEKDISSYESMIMTVGANIFIDFIYILGADNCKEQKFLGVIDYILDLNFDPNEIEIRSKLGH